MNAAPTNSIREKIDSIDWMANFRHAMSLIDHDFSYREDLAQEMMLDLITAMMADRIDAPTRRAMLIAKKHAFRRFFLWSNDISSEAMVNADDCVDPPKELSFIAVQRLQRVWASLTTLEKEAVLIRISGEIVYDRKHGKVVYNAWSRVLKMIDGRHSRDQRFVSCGNARK